MRQGQKRIGELRVGCYREENVNHVLLMMGGSGTRFGADIPKQFVEVEAQPVFSYVLDKYDRFNKIDSIVMVCHKDWVGYADEWAKRLKIAKYVGTVSGGSTRSESVLNGLRRLGEYAHEDDIVLIHDATHPYLDEGSTADAIRAAEEYGAATLARQQFDTVYRTDASGNLTDVVPREEIVSGASPELFTFGPISRIYEEASTEELASFTSAGAIALANGIPMKVIPTDFVNLKITYRHDMELFERLFHGYYFKG